MSDHNDHLPRNKYNKKILGMDEQSSGKLGQDAANEQGRVTKQNAKDAVAGKKP